MPEMVQDRHTVTIHTDPLSPQTKGNSQPTYNKLVHSAMMHLTTAGVIHKPTIDECVDCTNTLVKTSCGEIL